MDCLGTSPGALPSWRLVFASWYGVSIDPGCITHSPQSGPGWSPAFKIGPVLFPPSQVAGQAKKAFKVYSRHLYSES